MAVFLEGVTYESSISIRISAPPFYVTKKGISGSIFRQYDNKDKSSIMQIQVTGPFT